jgi:UDP-glucose 4-epimerase
MRVLITGGAGFIGSTLADRLLARGDEVFIVDNFETGRRDNLPAAAEFVEGSVGCSKIMPPLFEKVKPDVVVHAAASYKDPNNWWMDTVTNTVGTAYTCKLSLEHNVKRFIYFQTSLCYGQYPLEQPITLDHPIRPVSSYAISKTAGEQYVELSGLDFVSYRLANGYGPRNVSGPVPTFYSRLTSGEKCVVVDTRRDYVYIDDMLDIVEKGVDGVGSGYYHISTGSDMYIKELYMAVAKALGSDVLAEERRRSDDDVESILLDPSRTLEDYGILPDTHLEEGIEKAVAWYKEFGLTETYTHLKLDTKAE